MNFAHERFLTSMCQLVSLQVALSYKLLVALNADEGSLTSMCSHVSLQVSSLSKLFKTLFKWTNQYLFFIFGSLDLLKLLYLTKNQFKSYLTYKIE